MSETQSHKRAKAQAAGPKGQVEVKLPGNRRLDALTEKKVTATEIERGGNLPALEKAAGRLKASKAPKKVLTVPQPDMPIAVQAMKQKQVHGRVTNLKGSRSQRV